MKIISCSALTFMLDTTQHHTENLIPCNQMHKKSWPHEKAKAMLHLLSWVKQGWCLPQEHLNNSQEADQQHLSKTICSFCILQWDCNWFQSILRNSVFFPIILRHLKLIIYHTTKVLFNCFDYNSHCVVPIALFSTHSITTAFRNVIFVLVVSTACGRWRHTTEPCLHLRL